MGEGTLAWFERVRYMFEMADAASFGNRTLEHVQVDWKRSTTPPLPPPARGNVWGAGTISLGLPAIDRHLPSGGLTRAALHEVAGSGPEAEHGAAAALFIAGLLGRLEGPVLWVLERPDLFAPALAGVGLSPDRVIYAEAGRPDTVLPTMEEGLRHPGLAGVVGEISGRLTLTASRRLQLASEGSGVIGFALRRSRRHNDPILADPIAAMTRWRLGFLPSPPPFADAPDVPGLGRALWHLRLIRCRGGEPASWVVEACNATGHLRLAAEPAGRQVARRLSASG